MMAWVMPKHVFKKLSCEFKIFVNFNSYNYNIITFYNDAAHHDMDPLSELHITWTQHLNREESMLSTLS